MLTASQGSILWAFLVGFGGIVGSGALATGIGWVTQVVSVWCGIGT